MAHHGQDSQVIFTDSGDANPRVNSTTESPAGNGSNGEHHLVDAEEFKNMRMAIGTLGNNIFEMSLSDNLTGTRHIDIRLRRNNRPQPGGGVAPVAPGQAVGPGNNEAPQERVPPSDSAAAAQTNRRLKITVAADEPEPKPDADKEYLDQMRGWLMTVITLVAGIAFQAAIQPPQWVLAQQEAARLERNTSGPAAAPSPDAAHQRATKHWWSLSKVDRAVVYLATNGIAFVLAMSLLLVLVLVRGTSTASRVITSIVEFTMPLLFLTVGLTFVVAVSTNWLMTVRLFFFFVAVAAVVVADLLGIKLRACGLWLRNNLTCR